MSVLPVQVWSLITGGTLFNFVLLEFIGRYVPCPQEFAMHKSDPDWPWLVCENQQDHSTRWFDCSNLKRCLFHSWGDRTPYSIRAFDTSLIKVDKYCKDEHLISPFYIAAEHDSGLGFRKQAITTLLCAYLSWCRICSVCGRCKACLILKVFLQSVPGSIRLYSCCSSNFLSDKPGWAEWAVILKLCNLNPSKTSLPWTWYCTSWSVHFWLMERNGWCSDLTKFKKNAHCRFHAFLADKVLYSKNDNYQSVHTWIHTINSCICLVNGYFYRIMQQ